MPWLQFLIGLKRVGRFEAREYLRAITGATFTLPTDTPGVRELMFRDLSKAADYA